MLQCPADHRHWRLELFLRAPTSWPTI
jgi:hypothetical protein